MVTMVTNHRYYADVHNFRADNQSILMRLNLALNVSDPFFNGDHVISDKYW